jgi:hypothetical protein
MLSDHLRARWLREFLTHGPSLTPDPKRKFKGISQISLDARKLGCGADEYAPGNFVQGEIESQGWREEVGQYRGLMGSEHGER